MDGGGGGGEQQAASGEERRGAEIRDNVRVKEGGSQERPGG